MPSLSARRAWIEIVTTADREARKRSLSARRAWIEIVEFHLFASSGVVALRKESVDRNGSAGTYSPFRSGSLSARRAWIEISSSLDDILAGVVALRKESVDRNLA